MSNIENIKINLTDISDFQDLKNIESLLTARRKELAKNQKNNFIADLKASCERNGITNLYEYLEGLMPLLRARYSKRKKA